MKRLEAIDFLLSIRYYLRVSVLLQPIDQRSYIRDADNSATVLYLDRTDEPNEASVGSSTLDLTVSESG